MDKEWTYILTPDYLILNHNGLWKGSILLWLSSNIVYSDRQPKLPYARALLGLDAPPSSTFPQSCQSLSTVRKPESSVSSLACKHVSHGENKERWAWPPEDLRDCVNALWIVNDSPHWMNLHCLHAHRQHREAKFAVQSRTRRQALLHSQTGQIDMLTSNNSFSWTGEGTLASLGKTQSKMPSMLALMFLGFWLLGITATPRCTFHFKHTYKHDTPNFS